MQSDGHYRPGDIVGKAGLERQYNETARRHRRHAPRRRQQRRQSDAHSRRRGSHSRQADSADHRLRFAGHRRRGYGGQRRRRRRHGCAHRRSSRHGQPPTRSIPTISQCAFRADEWAKLNTDQKTPLTQSRHSGPARARLRFQDCDGHGDARIQSHPGKLHGLLPRLRQLLRARHFMLAAARRTAPWISTKPSSIPATFSFTPSAKRWASTASTTTPPDLGLGHKNGNRSARRRTRPDALRRMGRARLPPQMVCG